jgi:hypothetical protein
MSEEKTRIQRQELAFYFNSLKSFEALKSHGLI